MEFGVLLPHFGEHADRNILLNCASSLERFNFNSLWVRDHMLWSPHEIEGDDQTFLETFVVLASIASITQRIKLGTAVLIPGRHPLKLAQSLAALSWISEGRVIAGLGLGSNAKELHSVGVSMDDREKVFQETVDILRLVWTNDNVSWAGPRYQFEDVTMCPKPVSPLPIWYGGGSRAAVRRAVLNCDGWLPARLPLSMLDNRMSYFRELRESQQKSTKLAYIAFVCVDTDARLAHKCVDVQSLASSWPGNKSWKRPFPLDADGMEDLQGMIITGAPHDIVHGILRLKARGIEHFIFDLRFQFDRFDEVVQLIAEEVLPELR